MIKPVDGKLIYPYADRMWARSVNNEVKLIRIPEHTCIFLDTIESLHEVSGLNLIDVNVHSVPFPELYFEDHEHDTYASVLYDGQCWNIQTANLYLNSKAMKGAVVPLLEFLDEHAVDVNYKMVKEYLGLNE